jgi:L-asparaginase II
LIPPLVVEVERSGSIESTHLIDAAVVDGSGALVASAGEAEKLVAWRSSAKPLQARVALEAGWDPRTEESIAIACASHNGEPEHVAAVRAVLVDAGLDESVLACPPDFPLYEPAARHVAESARIYHNCSGKHAAMLSACVAAAWPLEKYLTPDHPLQVRIRTFIESLMDSSARAVLVDGCGAPTFLAPLVCIARAFRAIDGGREAAAMRAYPHLVGGTDRFDTDLMAASKTIVSKIGAEGLACVSTGEYGIALKARDGADRCRGPAMLAVLEQLAVGEELLERLPHHREPPVLGGGMRVGKLHVNGAIEWV